MPANNNALNELRAQSARNLRNQVADTIRHTPRTLKEIARIHDCSYHTARNIIQEFISEDKIATGLPAKGGASTYVMKNPNPVPEFHHGILGKSLTLSDWVRNYAAVGFQTAASGRVNDVYSVLVEIQHLAALVRDGLSVEETDKALKDYLARLDLAEAHVQATASLIQQVKAETKMWNPIDLAAYAQSEAYPKNAETYQVLLNQFNGSYRSFVESFMQIVRDTLTT